MATDSWGETQPVTTSPTSIKRRPDFVVDDWEMDDDPRDSDHVPASNKTIWEDANTKAPMPQVFISQSSSSSTSIPPQAAFQAPMRILKRPSASSSSSSLNTSNTDRKSLAEREAGYQAARDRIFGSGTSTSEPTTTPRTVDERKSPRTESPQRNVPTNDTSVPLRNPRGPTSGEETVPRGFGNSQARTAPSRNSVVPIKEPV